MKYIILIIGNIFLFINAYSQWYWQNPHPVGSHLEDCFFTSENTGYAVGWDGTIIKTTNSGNNWIQLYSGSNRFFYSVYFTNQLTGYVISGDKSFPVNGILLKTTDAGDTWIQIYTFNVIHLNCIHFINNFTGFIVGGNYSFDGSIFKTTNSGINWTQYLPNPTTNHINSVFFINDTVGYATGDNGRILKTINTGENWIYLNSGANYNIEFNSIYFPNSNIGFAAGTRGSIFKTTNAGINWSIDSTDVTENLWDVKFKDINTGFITAGGSWQEVTGKILRTTNSGNTWQIMQTNNIQNYRSVSIINKSIIAVGYWGTVVKSTNNGLYWTDLSNSMISNNIFDSYIFDSLKCIVVCDSSKVLSTSDGGNNWTTINLGGNIRLNSIYFINQNTGYIAGGYDNGSPNHISYSKIYKSTNGGVNWNLIFGFNNESYELKSVRFTSDSVGYCVGDKGVFKRTTNAGLNWSTQNLGGYNWLFSIFFINSNTGFICGYNGSFFKTTNAGNNWIQINSGTTSHLYTITFTSDSIGYIAGYNNQIYKTINGGLNWISINTNLSYQFDITNISFLNNDIGLAVGVSFPNYGRAGEIIKTTNGGLNWQHLSTFSSYPTYQYRGLNSIHFLNNKLGFIVGEHSTILKTTNGGNTVEITKISAIIPNSISLSQNYPNPFNPTTNIKYLIAKNSLVTLKVFDILGKEVATLVNEKLNAGEYEIQFPNDQLTNVQLPSGVYFYSMFADGKLIETKKMVLLK
jgi:photosystem II stability/assembly factor-like uncharacterized protein